ncbi:solute carrier family 26 member 6 [Malaya genurostris]|uniref:solute carrier family 26 member 6 n=1 Tax=Malaya genurostris TaxID=325434 RepID=UPI0026F3BC51|nr:solute carrier family 26 member 6 [Malaya genurostris]XP_058460461.1 solute carrier family 26 member 6 [Malaya genurostris]XP_058460462.1 solute carrier family 26 member 6 [Malaya genurostris]XP_058460463.1 solute carrier family 26 member 6 [Malaya genurostris]XP_058460464.1 solute carrier family 26 member 6 [Malaya genurostris]XP_058460465.1 solute carrier family 26 member 6 [Malaya genurostris]XP_058460466.1 solute carrier family 26 member 6 [Malaya genurostris]XP_058460467.1 solute car
MLNPKGGAGDSNAKVKPEFNELSYLVTRQCLHREEFNQLSQYDRSATPPIESIVSSVRNFRCLNTLLNFIPILRWLPQYSIKKDLVGDLTAGVTVAVMQIPQGMAYGLLAGVQANVGLYMAFFHCLVYAALGTSRHISVGAFAVVSLMTAKVVAGYATMSPVEMINGTSYDLPPIDPAEPEYTPIQVVTALSFVVGCYHLIMSVIRLGTLSALLSEPLVSGFTTAAAIHVLVSQMKDLLGVSIPRYKGAFKNILALRDIAGQIPNSNLPTVYTSVIVILFMIFMNEYLKPWSSSKCKFPIPAELMAVVGGTVASYYIRLGPDFAVQLVGEIPVGLPEPQMPPVGLLKLVAVDAIAITIVSYSIVMSMGMIFAQKEGYEVRANQELIAMGTTNIVGALFSCVPTACSLSRSLIQHQAGGKTQLTSVVSSMLILIVLLWVGPYFETLPRCVLASIIFVALKGMLWQVQHVKKFQREGSIELFVWLVTFFSVTIIDIDVGLLIGVIFSLMALYIKGWKSYYSLLGTVPDTAIYVDIGSHHRAEEVPHIKIFKYSGAVNFASRATFKKALTKEVGVSQKLVQRASRYDAAGEGAGLQLIKTVIIDLSSVPHIDTAACKMFNDVKKEMSSVGVSTLIASPADCVYETLLHAESIGEGGFHIFPTVHDAVLYAQGSASTV